MLLFTVSSYYNFPLIMHGKESILLGGNIRNGDFDGIKRFEVPLIQKSYFQSVFVTVYLCYLHNSKTNYRKNSKKKNERQSQQRQKKKYYRLLYHLIVTFSSPCMAGNVLF